MTWLVIYDYPDNECGHEIEEFPNYEEAKRNFDITKAHLHTRESVKLVMVLEEADTYER